MARLREARTHGVEERDRYTVIQRVNPGVDQRGRRLLKRGPEDVVSVDITMPQDPANGAVDAQGRPRDPGLHSLEGEAGSDGDNGGRTNGCPAARGMLPADLQHLGAGTGGNDAETADQEPPQIRPERLGGKLEEERQHGAGGGERTGEQDTGKEGPPEGRADGSRRRRSEITNARPGRGECGGDSGPYDRMHDHAGVDD